MMRERPVREMLFFVFVSISLREGRNYTLEMAELGDENWGA